MISQLPGSGRAEKGLTSSRTCPHLTIKEQYSRIRAGLGRFEYRWQIDAKQKWLASLWIRLNEHGTYRHIPDDPSEAMYEWSARSQYRYTYDVLLYQRQVMNKLMVDVLLSPPPRDPRMRDSGEF